MLTIARRFFGRRPGGAATDGTVQSRDIRWRDLGVLGERLWFSILIMSIALLAVAALAPAWRSYVAAAGIGGLVVLCAFAAGSALGFIFALPKTVPAKADRGGEDRGGGAASGAGKPSREAAATVEAARRYLETNGSLERISDWLTTMIVGIGLTQLHNVDQALSSFRDFISVYARVFPDGQGGFSAGILPAVSPLLLIFGGLAGFLFMYLYTRLLLSPLFNETEAILDKGPTLDDRTAIKVEAASIPDRKARSEHVISRTQAGAGPDLSMEDAVGRMFSALYKPSPQGFTEVLAIAAALSTTAATGRADYWFYLAAAFGQQHKHLHAKKGTPKADLDSARDNALDAARRAVELDPAYKARLRLLLSQDSGDDDLSDFAQDDAFKALVAS